nr:unnamed protein product [Callosobruchus analis]
MSIEDGFYRIGTVGGVFKQLYARNEFELCKQEFINLDVKTDTEITLRSAARKFSVNSSTQGYVRCQCKKSCTNKKCKCLASEYTCNSKCYSSAAVFLFQDIFNINILFHKLYLHFHFFYLFLGSYSKFMLYE